MDPGKTQAAGQTQARVADWDKVPRAARSWLGIKPVRKSRPKGSLGTALLKSQAQKAGLRAYP